MPADLGCPGPQQLEQLALGLARGPEIDALEEHVAGCPHCCRTLASLPASDPLVEAMRAARRAGPCPDAALGLIRRLRRACAQATTALDGQSTPADLGSFDFLDPPREPGELGWLGPYRARQVLGAGGMGVVFLADDPRLKRQVALKVIRPELVDRPDMRQRFLREAESVAAVEHDCIVAVHEVNEQRGAPYLVMPLLRGESLEARLRRAAGPLPLAETLRIARQAAEGLAAAHARGLVHRDIKPANIFLEEGQGKGGPSGRVKLLDFGLAQALSDDAAGQGAIVGTPAYMAPEQAAGLAVDGRADLFSLGCVLYWMATGKPAFSGETLYSLFARLAGNQPEAPAKINRSVPPELSRLIERLLAKDAQERPASADEVVHSLTALERRLTSRRRRLLLAGAAVIVLAGLVSWLVVRLAAPPVPPAPAPPGPVPVMLELDEPATRLLLVHGDEERPLDLEGRLSLDLAPGDYLLRPADREAKRQPVPDRFVVEPGQALTVSLRLVGEVRRHAEHEGIVWAVAASPRAGDRLVLSAGNDRAVAVWDTGGKSVQRFTEHEAPVRAVAFAPDGRSAASGGGNVGRRNDLSVRVWDVRTRRQTARFDGHESWVVALAFSPDGRRLASGGADGVVNVWDLKKGKKALELKATDGDGVNGVAFTPDGKHLLTGGGDGKVVVWSAADGKKLYALEGHAGEVRSVAVGLDGELAVSAGDDGTVRLWDLKTRKAHALRGHKGPVRQAALGPDGKRVLSAGDDGTVRLWDVQTGKELYRLAGHGGPVQGVAWAADGRRAVSCGQDGTVRLWELPR